MKKFAFLVFGILLAFIVNSCSNTQVKQNDKDKVSQDTVLSAEDIYKNAVSKVAMIISYKDGIPFSQGSGFFISKNQIVTNYHCVANSDYIEFKIIGKDDIFKEAKVVRASTKYDLAIIRTKQNFPYVDIDSLCKEKIGSKVYVIGNPKGLEGTISDGILSGRRENDGKEYIQITAPISPGNSGGPVLNENGKVIGVATFAFRNSQNINFAVPIKYVSRCQKITNLTIAEPERVYGHSEDVTMVNFVKDESSNEACFSIKNNTDNTINNIYYVVIYRDKTGEILNYYEDIYEREVAPHLGKRVGAIGFGDWYDYSCNGEKKFYNNRHLTFSVEFRVISYEIVE